MLSAAEDPTADAVIDELARRGTSVARMDTGDFPIHMSVSATNESARWDGRLWTSSTTMELADVASVYYRRPTFFRFPPGLSNGDALWASAEARMGVGGVLMSMTNALWVNHPVQIAGAEYKALQLCAAARAGLRVPCTVITNNHQAVMDFADGVGGPIICKALSSVLLADGDGLKITYTTPVDPSSIDPHRLAVTAHLFQEQIAKAFEVRVTMVGAAAFGVAIHADSERGRIDWRADYAALRYERIQVPEQVASAMGAYLGSFGLNYGAFDFVVTPDGEWVMLECNPSGQWLWLQEETGVPIAAALADLLADGMRQ